MIGTMAAIIGAIGLGASAGANIYAANKTSKAAQTAAQQQSQAGQQAMAYATQAYNQNLAALSPYLSVGNNSLATLGRLMSAPAGSRYAAPPVPQISLPAIGGSATPQTMPSYSYGGGVPLRAYALTR